MSRTLPQQNALNTLHSIFKKSRRPGGVVISVRLGKIIGRLDQVNVSYELPTSGDGLPGKSFCFYTAMTADSLYLNEFL